ncbi:hypothetical protein TARUN_10034 [Trichoderma arundinaceum]|uniref:Uncharacterized protein n=1 Tax=Trichoderma arundinaceum TaxID=490622 RepID=A0A395N7X0_TRIAR|nr:hypothetical protein TARUN_10034 [Trichoderma arundinaceum]
MGQSGPILGPRVRAARVRKIRKKRDWKNEKKGEEDGEANNGRPRSIQERELAAAAVFRNKSGSGIWIRMDGPFGRFHLASLAIQPLTLGPPAIVS